MVEVELAPGDPGPFLVQVECRMAWLGLYEHSCIHRFVEIGVIRQFAGICDRDFPPENAFALEHTKDAAGQAEIGIICATLEVLWHILAVLEPLALTSISSIEERQTTVAQRFNDRTQHAFERTARDDICTGCVLQREGSFPEFRVYSAWIRDEQGCLGRDICLQAARVEGQTLFGQLMVPDRLVAF